MHICSTAQLDLHHGWRKCLGSPLRPLFQTLGFHTNSSCFAYGNSLPFPGFRKSDLFHPNQVIIVGGHVQTKFVQANIRLHVVSKPNIAACYEVSITFSLLCQHLFSILTPTSGCWSHGFDLFASQIQTEGRTNPLWEFREHQRQEGAKTVAFREGEETKGIPEEKINAAPSSSICSRCELACYRLRTSPRCLLNCIGLVQVPLVLQMENRNAPFSYLLP